MGGREGGREGKKKRGREGGREGGRERGRERGRVNSQTVSISSILGPHQTYPGIFLWLGAIKVFFLMRSSVVRTLAMS